MVTSFFQGMLPLPGIPLRLGDEDVFLSGLVGEDDGEGVGVVLEAFLLDVKAFEEEDAERFAAEWRPAVVGS